MSSKIPTFTSLIKFSTPILVSVQNKKPSDQKSLIPISEEMRTEELLSQIIPPKEYVLEHGQLWIQTVVSTPATKSQVVALEIELEKMIKSKYVIRGVISLNFSWIILRFLGFRVYSGILFFRPKKPESVPLEKNFMINALMN